MKQDRHALQRLRRLERVREVAKQTAVMESAEAEGTLGQLVALRDRTRAIAASYRPPVAETDGGDLRRMRAFVEGVGRLTGKTEQDITAAQSRADALRGDLAAAQRRLSLASERTIRCRKALNAERPAETPARRSNWHET